MGEIDIIAEVIRQHRAGKKLSQETLAEMSFTNREYISRLENGRVEANEETLKNINDVLHCPALELLIDGYRWRKVKALLN